MTPADGPTEVVVGSHVDPSLSPESGAQTAAFCSRKQDVIIWDQRLWHRRGHGGGGPSYPRILLIAGFMTIQTVGTPATIHPAMARAWLTAGNPVSCMISDTVSQPCGCIFGF